MDPALLIDISRLMGRRNDARLPTGVDRVCFEYIRHFGKHAQAVLQWHGWRRILPQEASQDLFRLLEKPSGRFSRDASRIITRVCLPPWPSQRAPDRFYLNAGHSGLDRPGLTDWLARTEMAPVFVVHDLIPITHPEYCRPGEPERHAGRLRLMLTAGRGIVTNSEATMRELADFARSQRLRMPPAIAAPLAPAGLSFDRSSPPPLAQPYFVVVSTIEPRKNHTLLLHVWRELVERLGDAAPHLVVIGQRGWECENVVDLLERAELLRGRVHEIHDCSDALLAQYVGHARALLFPSFAEGYGMPLVEALMLGTPAIATPLAAFREIAGDIPDYLHPLDGPAWMSAVLDYARPDSERRAAQLRRLQGWRAPTWDDHFRRVEGLLGDLR